MSIWEIAEFVAHKLSALIGVHDRRESKDSENLPQASHRVEEEREGSILNHEALARPGPLADDEDLCREWRTTRRRIFHPQDHLAVKHQKSLRLSLIQFQNPLQNKVHQK